MLFSQMSSEDDQDEPIDFEDESETFSPEANVDYSETKRLVKEMIDRLPERQRIPILLYYMEDYSVGQIAQAMECNESTIKSRLSAGRKQIKKDVLALEKQGTKLYCAPLVPFLFWMFHTPASAATISAAEAATLSAGIATGSAMGAATAAGTAVGSTVGTGSAVGAATATGTTVGATMSAGSAVGATAMTGTTVGATVAAGTAVTGTAASAGTAAAAATGLSLAAKIGIVAALAACVGGGAVAGYVVTSSSNQRDPGPAIEATSADVLVEEPEPAPQNIVYEYGEIGDDFYEEHNNILGIMWGLMEAESSTNHSYESDDPYLMWYANYEYIGRYWPELDDGTGKIIQGYDADLARYGWPLIIASKDLIREYTYVMFDGRTEDLSEDQAPSRLVDSGHLRFLEDDYVGICGRGEQFVDQYYPRVRAWIEHPDGSCTVFLYSFVEGHGHTGNGVYSGPYQFELLPDPGSKYGYIVHDFTSHIGEEEVVSAFIEEAKEDTRTAATTAATDAGATGEIQDVDNAGNAITSKDGSVMPYKAIVDEYSEDYYNLDIWYYGSEIIETDDYYEFPECRLEVTNYLDSSLVEGKSIGDTVTVNGKPKKITRIEEDDGYKHYLFDSYNDGFRTYGNDYLDDECYGLVETSHGLYVFGQDDYIQTRTVYEGPVRFSKNVVILGPDGGTVNEPQEYFYVSMEELHYSSLCQREHGYNQYYEEIELYGKIKTDDQGYVIWYEEIFTP